MLMKRSLLIVLFIALTPAKNIIFYFKTANERFCDFFFLESCGFENSQSGEFGINNAQYIAFF